MKSYTDLDIYKESKRLAIAIHKSTLGPPKIELYEEGSQIRKSSKSMNSLIVEGYGRRRYKADFAKYLIYSHAACDETMAHLDFLFEAGSLVDQNQYNDLKTEYATLSKINQSIQYVEEHWNDFSE